MRNIQVLYSISECYGMWILNAAVNSQPKQLSSEQSRHLRHQLQDVRDRINRLLDNLSCAEPTDGVGSMADGSRATAAVGAAASTSSASNAAAAGSFDPLTRHKYTGDGTTTGAADTGEFLCV